MKCFSLTASEQTVVQLFDFIPANATLPVIFVRRKDSRDFSMRGRDEIDSFVIHIQCLQIWQLGECIEIVEISSF